MPAILVVYLEFGLAVRRTSKGHASVVGTQLRGDRSAYEGGGSTVQ